MDLGLGWDINLWRKRSSFGILFQINIFTIYLLSVLYVVCKGGRGGVIEVGFVKTSCEFFFIVASCAKR